MDSFVGRHASLPASVIRRGSNLSFFGALLQIPRGDYVKQRWSRNPNPLDLQSDMIKFTDNMIVVSALLGAASLAMLFATPQLGFEDGVLEQCFVAFSAAATLFCIMNVLLCTRLSIAVSILRTNEIRAFVETTGENELLVPLKYYAVFNLSIPAAIIVFLLDRYGQVFSIAVCSAAFLVNLHPVFSSARTIQVLHELQVANNAQPTKQDSSENVGHVKPV